MISWKTSRLIRLLAHPLPPLRQQVVFFPCLPVCRGSSLYTEKGAGGGARGAKQYDREQAGLSINYSVLSGEEEWKWNKKVTLYIHSTVYNEHRSTLYSVQYSDTQRETLRANRSRSHVYICLNVIVLGTP